MSNVEIGALQRLRISAIQTSLRIDQQQKELDATRRKNTEFLHTIERDLIKIAKAANSDGG